jgi:GTP pyrophosphokinase
VVGFITRGYGVSVHRKDCPNASAEKQAEEPGRWVEVSWVESDQEFYQTSIEISAKDRDGLTLDVAMALSTQKVKVTNLSARSQPDGYATVYLVLSVKDIGELASVINKLSQVQGVFLVKRVGA